MLIDGLLILAGYLIGSISTAMVVGNWLGLPDPRTQGSGNPGATNMLRIGGKKAGILTLLGDLLKGAIPVLLAKWLDASTTIQAAVGLMAFLGHLYPVFFKFKGGKGVATTFGVTLGLYWPIGLAALLVWILIAVVFRISSLAALVATLLIPVCFYWFQPEPAFLLVSATITALLYWRHRSNISNLIKGSERRIGG